MKLLLLILLLFPVYSYSQSYPGYYNPPKTIAERYQRQNTIQRENMQRALEREYYETGRISSKTPMEIEAMKSGYGYQMKMYDPYTNRYEDLLEW